MAKGINFNLDTTKSEFQNPMVELRQGDGNYQSLHVTITSNGEPLDLTGWTITFMGTTNGLHKIVDSSSVVENASQGTFNYTPTKAWGQDMGEYKKAYFKFTNGDQSASSANFRVTVFEAVDLTEEEAGDYISVVDQMIDKVKTDMDSKLASTQTTLTNTQNQATTVQKNVDTLNTNVNNLVAQNNNIKSSNNTWTGSNVFNNTITGRTGVSIAPFSDFADVAKNMQTYVGKWFINGNGIANGPIGSTGWASIEVFSGNSNATGYITVNIFASNQNYIASVNNAVITNWIKLPSDATVVHNTGNETVAGNKAFTGSNTFSQPITGSIKSKDVNFTDLSAVAKNMNNYAGVWYVSNQSIAHSPMSGWYTIEVIPTTDSGSGVIKVVSTAYWQGYYIANVGSGVLGEWIKVAEDGSVVHNTGNENIAGNKSFAGDNSFSGNVSFSGSAAFTGVTKLNSRDMSYSSTTGFNTDGILSGTMYVEKINGVVYISSKDLNMTRNSTITLPSGYRPIHNMNFSLTGMNSSYVTAAGYGYIDPSTGVINFYSNGFGSGNASLYFSISYPAAI